MKRAPLKPASLTMSELGSFTLAKSRFGFSLPVLVCVVAFAAVLASGSGLLLRDPGDAYWHIAVGRWILAHHAVPHIGIFSETKPNAPWVAQEWLAEAIFAAAYNALGWNGIVLITALAFAGALAILTRALLDFLEPAHALIGMVTAWGMVIPHLLARPHILTLPILVLWIAKLVEARARDRAPPLWLVPLMALWANLHGSFIVGLLFTAFFAGEALVTAPTLPAKLDVTRNWGLFGILSLAASVITPFGFATLWFPFYLMHMKFALAIISEWRSPNFQHVTVLEIWLLVGLSAVLSFGVRLPPTRIAMVLLLIQMSLSYRRNADLLGFIVPLLVAEPVAALIRKGTGSGSSVADRILGVVAGRASLRGLAVAAVALLALGTAFLGHPVAPAADETPAAAIRAARTAHVAAGPVLNEYSFGGYLIFSGIHPFIDGRTDMYGDRFLKRYIAALNGGPDLASLLNEYHVTWTLLTADSPAVTFMSQLPGWHRLYGDKTAVVYTRVGPTG